MNTIIKYKNLLLSILGNLGFLVLNYQMDGHVHITIIHLIFGIIPLIFSIKKHFGHLV
jgi:hypothetical protein